ncbi:hypothetical protein M378DRAFT_87700, partial [Amanita muscaria Koide BX008]
KRKGLLLYGMGCIGKTQICLKFIEQHEREKWFSDVFWIDASSEHTIDLCLRQIGQKYKVDATPSSESVLEWISDRDDWLVVFDNADGGCQVVEKFIPPGNRGGFLITSRDKGLARITSGTCLEVTEMGEDDAIALLLKSAMIDNNSVNVATAAKKLVAALGCIPLAIDQAGAYVMLSGCGLDHYLDLFMEHRAKLMSDEEFRGASLYNKTTYGTWEISTEAIKCRTEGQNRGQSLAAQSALTLHKIFAFLHHDNISQEIFKNAALNFMERKGEITNGLPQSISLLDCKTLFLDDDGKWDGFQFEAGIKVLVSFSLIKSSGKLYSVHPLVQTWSRDRIPVGNANASDYCKKSKALLACSLRLDYQEDNYRFCRLLAPHITANTEHGLKCIADEEYFDDEAERFGLVYDRVGDWIQAEKPYSEMMNARKETLGASHPDTFIAMGNLASTYNNQGRWKEAENLKVQVMEARKETLGASHPHTLTAMESLFLQVMEARKEILGASHPHTLLAMGNLASTYRDQGRWKEAENLQVQQVMEARKEILGASHPDTLTAMANLASTYRNQGRWKEAENLEV